MQQNIVRQLRSFLYKQDILATDLWREIYARDASYFDIKPLCVVRPSTMEQIQKVIALARANNISVTFRTGGTSGV